MIENVIESKNLSKLYGNKYAVKDCTFSVKKGQIVGLVGLNGAGKTTLIRLLSSIVSPTSGSFSLFGVENSGPLHTVLNKVSCMIEHPALYKDLTGRENLEIFCSLHGIANPISSGYIEEKFKYVGLLDEYHSNKKVSGYSLGMRQRLGIAIATINEPELMILDEPTNGLDPEGIQEFRNLLIKINKQQNTTMLVSSHILSELEKFATSYIFIDNGIIKQQIDADDLEHISGCTTILKTDNDKLVYEHIKHLNFDCQLKDESIYIYNVKNMIDVLNSVSEVNAKYLSYKEVKNSLEEHFLKLIGDLKWKTYYFIISNVFLKHHCFTLLYL